MSKQRAVDFANLATPDLTIYDNAAGFRNNAYYKLENSKPKTLVNATCKAEMEVIRKIIASRNLEEMIALELRLQRTDLEKDARSARDKKNVEQGLADLQSGILAYNALKFNPKQYKEAAKTYTERNRDTRLDVPKDGMRYALTSQMTRLQNRRSLQLSDEEQNLLTVRRNLINAIREEYSLLQEKVVHGNADKI